MFSAEAGNSLQPGAYRGLRHGQFRPIGRHKPNSPCPSRQPPWRQRHVALSGGQLLSTNEYIGSSSSGAFTQTGGMNSVAMLSIGSSGSYLLGGGSLQVANMVNHGLFAGGSIAAVLDGNGIVDLSGGTLQDTDNISVSMGANSLLIVPPGFNTAVGFAGYSTLGLTHTLGTTLNVAAGQSINASGTISDPVNNRGTISGGTLNLTGGLILSGGQVQLGSGSLVDK